MKKHSFLKSIGIAFAIIFILSWVFPTGSLQTGAFQEGSIRPFGLLDLVRVPISVLSNFINYGLYVLVIGGFYGVLNQSGVYAPIVDNMVKKAKKNKMAFLVGVVITNVLLSAITGLNFVLFILVPFLVTVLIKLDYKKMTALTATVGAIIVGNFASLYAFKINGYLNYYFNLSIHQDIWVKLGLLTLSTTLLILFLIWDDKKNPIKDEKISDLPLYEKKDSKKQLLPVLFISISIIVFLIIAGINWKYMFNVSFFEDMYTSISEIKLGDYAIINNIIGNTNPIGWWGMSETVIVLIFVSLTIGWIYNLKLKETYEGFVKGAKEMLKPALYIVAANILVGALAYAGYNNNSTIYIYIANAIVNMSETFNIYVTALYSFVASLFYNDLPTAINASAVSANSIELTMIVTTVKDYPMIAIIMQMMHAIMMMFLPTSLFLAGGLAYLNISYLDWLKHIWRFVLAMIGLALLTIIVLLLL